MLIGLSAWLVVGLLAEWILPAPKEVVESLRRVVAPADGGRGTLLTLFLMALTPAICEEALFRGPILRGLRTRLSPAGAAILTGLLFGIYHLDPWRLLPTAILGVALSGIALASDSIVPAMVAHFVNNACLILLARLHADDTDALPTSTKLPARHARCCRPCGRDSPDAARCRRREAVCSLLHRLFTIRTVFSCYNRVRMPADDERQAIGLLRKCEVLSESPLDDAPGGATRADRSGITARVRSSTSRETARRGFTS